MSALSEHVLIELRRAYPEEVEKGALQRRTGLGTEDLRSALEELFGVGDVVEGDTGWAYAPTAGPTEAEDGAQEAQEQAETAREAPVGPEGQGDVRRPLDAPHRARILVDVVFQLSPGETPVETAQMIASLAGAGIVQAYPDLTVSSELMSLDVYDGVRRLYP